DLVLAGDTGPGMAIIDGVARLVDPTLPYDAGGALARAGVVDEGVLDELLGESWFASPPPRSTGRERVGAEYAVRLHRRVPGPNGVRTAMALTVESIVDFCRSKLPPAAEVVVAGGGCHHPVLMSELAARLARHDIEL